MGKLRIYSASEQVAGHLKQQVGEGEITGEMPGAAVLAAKLGVNHKTVKAALSQLERDGILIARGNRKARGISSDAVFSERRGLKVAIMLYEPADARTDYMLEIRHELSQAGHFPFYVRKSCLEIGSDVEQLARFVKKTDADAWLVQAGSREILEWFAAQSKPAFCLFGKFRDLNIAGTRADSTVAYEEAVRELVRLGHRSIVLLARPQRKLPQPGTSEQVFLDTLEDCGIRVSDYHFPLWENSKKGFQRCLEELFRVTPPTALITDETLIFSAVEHFLAQRGLRVPQDVSVICGHQEPDFAWRTQSVAYFAVDSAPWVKHVLRWAAHIHQGKDYRRKLYCQAEYITGGTVGVAPGKRR